MTKRTRTLMLAGLAAVALIAVATPPYRADLAIITHQANDPLPQRVGAAVDLGVVGFSFLLTWSRQLGH